MGVSKNNVGDCVNSKWRLPILCLEEKIKGKKKKKRNFVNVKKKNKENLLFFKISVTFLLKIPAEKSSTW